MSGPSRAPNERQEPPEQGSSRAAEWLANFPKIALKDSDMPTYRSQKLLVRLYTIGYGARWWYRSGERSLNFEEIKGMINRMHEHDDSIGNFENVFDIIENRGHRVNKALDELTGRQKEDVCSHIGVEFDELLAHDPGAREAFALLKGL